MPQHFSYPIYQLQLSNEHFHVDVKSREKQDIRMHAGIDFSLFRSRLSFHARNSPPEVVSPRGPYTLPKRKRIDRSKMELAQPNINWVHVVGVCPLITRPRGHGIQSEVEKKKKVLIKSTRLFFSSPSNRARLSWAGFIFDGQVFSNITKHFFFLSKRKMCKS